MTTTIDTAAPDGFDIVSRSRHRYVGPAWTGEAYRVSQKPSLTVAIEHVGDETVVREVEVGVYGVGSDVREAWADFQEAIEQHLDVLQRQEALSSELARQLAYLLERLHR